MAELISKTEADILLRLKTIFDEGLKLGMENRSNGYAYEQHALRMRLETINEEPQSHLYPYNGDFTFEANSELADQISALTKKCGFQIDDVGTTIHFYCLDASSTFMSYLAELGKTNEFIHAFHTSYLEQKTINSSFKNSFFLQSPEKLDLNRLDHQVFYFLMHTVFNEEHQAYVKIGSLN